MNPSSRKGNNPELWDTFMNDLDERLQFGLLDYLRRIHSYHFEGESLFIEVASAQDAAYFSKPAVLQQLKLLAGQSTGITSVVVKEKPKE